MADYLTFCAHWIITHVPAITYMGLMLAGVLGATYLFKKSRPCGVLALCAALYAITPYLPHLTHS